MANRLNLSFFEKVVETLKSNRKIELEKAKSKPAIIDYDIIGRRDYLLKGTYSYTEVIKLNQLTGENRIVVFGYNEKGEPIAFIGLKNSIDFSTRPEARYYYPKVCEYGKPLNFEVSKIRILGKKKASKIKKYTVYGAYDPRKLKGAAPVEKVDRGYDYRSMSKNQIYTWELPTNILSMDKRFCFSYPYRDIKTFATGYKGKFRYYDKGDPVQFAIVGENKPVAIIGLFGHPENITFKDVWEYGKAEPSEESIRFLSEKEAKKIKKFKLYLFRQTINRYLEARLERASNESVVNEVFVEAIDRTLDPRFDFTMEDGSDYRLQTVRREKTSVKSLGTSPLEK